MFTRKEILRLICLVVAVLPLAGCGAGQAIVPTFTPTASAKPTATSTSTLTLTPTSTLDPFAIDAGKEFVIVPSYEDVVAHVHDGTYVEAPDPLANIEAFNSWYDGKYTLSLGDLNNMNMNVRLGFITSYSGMRVFDSSSTQDILPIQGKPAFFYFVHNGTVYPAITLALKVGNDPPVPFTLILCGKTGIYSPYGSNVLQMMFEGVKISDIKVESQQQSYLSDDYNQMISLGLDGSNKHKVLIGVAAVEFYIP